MNENWQFYERTGSVQGEHSTYGIKCDAPKHWVIPPLNIRKGDAVLMASSPQLLELVKGLSGSLSRMIDKHDPDSIEAEWLSHAHELLIQNAKKVSS